ncbi:MAG TPA: hypothetical protein PL152_09865 [Steroidobacteraceae bacterium]|nr:hypothetical protein [Steroidobacteraceae bacterium]
MRSITLAAAAALLATGSLAATAQDANFALPVPELEQMLANAPFTIVAAEISRPKAKGDITLKADVSFDGKPPIRVKLRKAEPGADTFNNVPRYDLAAYELQKLYLDPAEYVVPPTALRFVPLGDFRKYEPDTKRTFSGADEVLSVMQYWLQDIKVIADVYDPAMFESDPVYARHIGQLNILTDLIDHGDSNVGNFLISKTTPGARVFSVDNGVAFASSESDRGRAWAELRVKRLPADAIDRLRKLTLDSMQQSLGVLVQWEMKDGAFHPVPPTANLAPSRGVRRSDAVLQMGLTQSEINKVWRNLQRLLAQVDSGNVTTF